MYGRNNAERKNKNKADQRTRTSCRRPDPRIENLHHSDYMQFDLVRCNRATFLLFTGLPKTQAFALAKLSFAAAIVFSTSFSLCAALTNAASYCEGGR